MISDTITAIITKFFENPGMAILVLVLVGLALYIIYHIICIIYHILYCIVIFIINVILYIVELICYVFNGWDPDDLESKIEWCKSLSVLVIIILAVASASFVAVNYSDDIAQQSKSITNTVISKLSEIDPLEARAKEVATAMDYTSPAVRNAALSMIKSSNGGSYNVGQICDIFDHCYNHWIYVNDPCNEDYFALASDSVALMRGDCDDFAIMMASLVQTIGGNARVVLAPSGDGKSGHAYAEVHLGTNENDVDKLTKSISRRYNGATIYYSHLAYSDGSKEYWLNLDWQEKHPGGEYYKSYGKCQVIDSDGKYTYENRDRLR